MQCKEGVIFISDVMWVLCCYKDIQAFTTHLLRKSHPLFVGRHGCVPHMFMRPFALDAFRAHGWRTACPTPITIMSLAHFSMTWRYLSRIRCLSREISRESRRYFSTMTCSVTMLRLLVLLVDLDNIVIVGEGRRGLTGRYGDVRCSVIITFFIIILNVFLDKHEERLGRLDGHSLAFLMSWGLVLFPRKERFG